jgi:purine nucleosidase
MSIASWPASAVTPRARVIIDNDFSGDPDGLVQLAHHLLSPAVDIRVVLGTHLRAGDSWDTSTDTADRAAALARDIALRCARTDVQVIAGSNVSLNDASTPIRNAAAAAIIAEAMRDDTDLPLFVACGAGLTEIASAWLIEPRIAERLTVVWIGGHEHAEIAEPPPNGPDMEYNCGIDPIAARVVFNDSDLRIWQVPRDAYRSTITSRSELIVRMAEQSDLGRHLFDALADVVAKVSAFGMAMGETYVLGDSPLVLLTALWTAFEPSPASSNSVVMPCPRILDSGMYEPRPDGRPLRVFTAVDNRLMFEDLYAKLAILGRS